jgi:hypothetical protein
VHLIRRLGQVECLDCGLVREPVLADAALTDAVLADAALVPAGSPVPPAPRALAGSRDRPDAALAEEVGRALDRLLGRR